MANDGSAAGIVAAGVAINAVSAIQRSKDITSTLWAGCAFALSGFFYAMFHFR